MFTIIGIMLAGISIGYAMRFKRLSWIPRVITVFIWLLLFLLGVNVGANERIVKGLYSLGVDALIITLAAVIGSVLAAWGLWYLLYQKNKEKP